MPYSSTFIRYERTGSKVTPVRVHKAIQPDGALKTMRVTEMGWPVSTPNFGPNLEIAYETEGDGEMVPHDWISVRDFWPMNRFDLIDAGFLQLARLYDGFTNAPYLELDQAALDEHDKCLGDSFMNMDNSRFIFTPAPPASAPAQDKESGDAA
jgi:hypothetical protein